ncbi:hypothetical protein FQB35_04815 [Crassaminicella thermophila]|uniref:VanZ like family protein n=1 Tax=Crassaminicella thermophila TaxID=2599308 RepID=A0A5C0SC95_CRATE|nr:hypothetical protein [Crassaminicella thermophila]QEK11740.1 hypothetical protein FQB35_04815 [Crassaminicella thermophila]
MTKRDISKFLIIFFSIIMLLIMIGFIKKKEYSCIYNLIAIYLGYLLFTYFEYKKKFHVRNSIKGLVIITAILHNLFGEYFKLYTTTKWFDKGLHLFGTFSVSLFCYSIINSSIAFFPRSKVFIFILIVSTGITIGTLFEHLEFITDSILKSKTQTNLVDTDLDLIFNTLGATIAGVLGMFRIIFFDNQRN